MKAKILIGMVLICLLLTGCGCVAHIHTTESRALCIPYCNERNMSYDEDYSVVCDNSVECVCRAVPILRG